MTTSEKKKIPASGSLSNSLHAIETDELEKAIYTLNTMLWHVLDDEHPNALLDAIEVILHAYSGKPGKRVAENTLSDAIEVALIALKSEMRKRATDK